MSYVIASPAAFAMRMSDWKRVPIPSACAIAGMSSVPLGALVLRGVGDTGVTRLIENGTEDVVVPCRESLPAVPLTRVTVIVQVVEPTGSPVGLTVNWIVVPPAESAPEAGKAVIHGTSGLTLKVSLFVAVAPKPGTR